MQRNFWGAALTIGLFVSPAGGQQALHCDDLDPRAEGDATRAFECVSKLSSDLETVLERVHSLEGRAHEVPDARLVPRGAIVAFDDSGGCPSGWSPFSPANSRLIIGAHHGGDLGEGTLTLFSEDEQGKVLTQYKYKKHGGLETVTLTPEQMPAHKHTIPKVLGTQQQQAHFEGQNSLLTGEWSGNRFSLDDTDSTGAGEPHNNMPPYIALYFCKKD